MHIQACQIELTNKKSGKANK